MEHNGASDVCFEGCALLMVNEPFYLTLSFIRSKYVTRFDSATLAQLNIFTELIDVLAMRNLSGPKVYDLRAAEDA
jgi:hypothetical protein